jgi:hypothetical protein
VIIVLIASPLGPFFFFFVFLLPLPLDVGHA